MKNIIMILGFIIIPFYLNAQEASMDEAKKVAKNFYKSKYKSGFFKSTTANKSEGAIKNTITKKYNGHNSFYINNIEGGGWVIVSSHKATGPVFAYSGNGEVVEKDMPKVFWDWMKQYEIVNNNAFKKNLVNKEKEKKWKKYANDSIAGSFKLKSYTVSEVLIDTYWGQGSTSDGKCPGYNSWMKRESDDGETCIEIPCLKIAAGCGPVAMAQIMNYWGYAIGNYAAFDWWDMPLGSLQKGKPNYIAEQRAVSYLIKRCGETQNSEYTCKGTEQSINEVKSAFPKFGYKESTLNKQRKKYRTYTYWVNMLKDEINAGRPVYYVFTHMNYEIFDGKDGHGFICDGHDGDNTFYFNLGYNGKGDLWSDFEDLQSIDDCSGCPDFDYTETNNHYCIIGIQPDVSTDLSLKNVTLSTASEASLPTNQTYQAKNSIKVAGDNSNFIVNNNVTCRFVAGSNITLNAGFQAKIGCTLHARVYKKFALKSKKIDQKNNYVVEEDNLDGENINVLNQKSFSIYPNPANEYITISSGLNYDVDILVKIYDMFGKSIYQNSLKFKNEYLVNVKGMPSGVYVLKIFCENNIFNEKFIKQ